MRFLLVLAFAGLAMAGTISSNQQIQSISNIKNRLVQMLLTEDNEIDVDTDDGFPAEVAPYFILSWQARRAIRKMQKQMPCGWPEYGIPPLAPLKLSEANFHYEKGIVETTDELYRFRVDGLDNFKINKFKINMILSKVTFDFNFRNIKVSAQRYDTNTFVDALEQMGITVQYEGDGSLEFALTDFRVKGVLRYKIPILWGSVKITSLETQFSLGGCDSNISGFLGEGPINRFVNDQIEQAVVAGINENSDNMSNYIENNLVPKINQQLKGNNFWTILDMIFSGSEDENEDDPIVTNCVAPADPWA